MRKLVAEIAEKRANHPVGAADPRDAEEVAKSFQSDYAYFQYHYVEFITEHLVDLSRVFEGDLQKVIILAIIGQAFLHYALRRADGKETTVSAITSSSIADITGIPRETVRRKLRALSAVGWIEKHDKQGWRLRVKDGIAPAATDLAELDKRGIVRAARLTAAFAKRL